MNDEGRRCALPGCDVPIQTVRGRPERRYCTAAHRAAARKARRAATQVQRSTATTMDLTDTLPWLRPAGPPAVDRRAEPVAPAPIAAAPVGLPEPGVAEPGAVVRAAARRSRHTPVPTPRPRRHRALAVLGVAGILAGGYAVLVRPEVLSTATPVAAAPDGESLDAWARRATVALTALNRQLDTLDRTEEQWRTLPASHGGVVPAPVTALQERRAMLQQRRAAVASQLDTYRALHATQQDLADSEQQLRVVEKALSDAPPAPRSPAQDAVVTALDQQRDMRVRQRDAQRAEVATLEDGVASAARTPLPDDDAATARVTDDVLAVIRHDDPRGAAPTTDPGADVLAQLHAQAREVAQDARRAERARDGAPTRTRTTTGGARMALYVVPEDDDTIETWNASRPTGGRHRAAD